MGRKRQLEGGVLAELPPGSGPEVSLAPAHQFAPGNPYLDGLPQFRPGSPYLVGGDAPPPLAPAAPSPVAPAALAAEPKKRVVSQDSWRLVRVEPEVQDLADHFGLDERITGKLQEALSGREEPGTDLEVLWEILDEARNPPGLTMIKVKEMLEGTFRAGEREDAGVKALAEKFSLDERAAYKLSEVLATKPNSRDVLKLLDVHLAASNNPSALVMLRLADLRRDVPLGEVPYGSRGYRDRPYLGKYDKDGKRAPDASPPDRAAGTDRRVGHGAEALRAVERRPEVRSRSLRRGRSVSRERSHRSRSRSRACAS